MHEVWLSLYLHLRLTYTLLKPPSLGGWNYTLILNGFLPLSLKTLESFSSEFPYAGSVCT